MSNRYASLDDLTNMLFSEMREKTRSPDLGILKCPRCPDRLEALDLEHFMEEGVQYQRILWMCKGISKGTCSFPIDMPHNVFWTKRTVEQEQAGFIPLPQIHLLPRRYHHLYPMFFATKGSHALCLIGQDKKKRKKAFETSSEAGSGNSSDRRKRIRSQSTDTLTAFDEDCSVSLRSDTPMSGRATRGSTECPPSPESNTSGTSAASEGSVRGRRPMASATASTSASNGATVPAMIPMINCSQSFASVTETVIPSTLIAHSLAENVPLMADSVSVSSAAVSHITSAASSEESSVTLPLISGSGESVPCMLGVFVSSENGPTAAPLSTSPGESMTPVASCESSLLTTPLTSVSGGSLPLMAIPVTTAIMPLNSASNSLSSESVMLTATCTSASTESVKSTATLASFANVAQATVSGPISNECFSSTNISNESVQPSSASLSAPGESLSLTSMRPSESKESVVSTTSEISLRDAHVPPLGSVSNESMSLLTAEPLVYSHDLPRVTISPSFASEDGLPITTSASQDTNATTSSASMLNESAISTGTSLSEMDSENYCDTDDTPMRIVVIDEEIDEDKVGNGKRIPFQNTPPATVAAKVADEGLSSRPNPSPSCQPVLEELRSRSVRVPTPSPTWDARNVDDVLPGRIRSLRAFDQIFSEESSAMNYGSIAMDDEEYVADFAEKCEQHLKKDKEKKEEMVRGAVRCVPFNFRKGEPSPFESWMLSRAGMFDKHDWRKPVRLGCGTALDAFATNYNLLYSREKFLMALGEEMRNRGIVRHDATLTMRQQRMMEKVLKSWNEEDGEQQLEQLKKSIDISALRGQVCHGAGAAEVLRGGRAHDSVDRSVGEWGGEAGGTSGAGAETCTTGLNRTVFKRVSLQEAVPDECEAAFEGEMATTTSSSKQIVFPENTDTDNVVKRTVQEYVERYVMEMRTSTHRRSKTNRAQQRVEELEEPEAGTSEARSVSPAGERATIFDEYYDGYFNMENNFEFDY